MLEQTKLTLYQTLTLAAVLAAALVLVAGASAWTAPVQGPTGADATPFFHTGPQNQVKEGSLGVGTAIVDQVCFGPHCKSSWAAVPNCRICVKSGTANGPYSAEECKAFNGGNAVSYKEDSSNGRGTTVEIRVICP